MEKLVLVFLLGFLLCFVRSPEEDFTVEPRVRHWTSLNDNVAQEGVDFAGTAEYPSARSHAIWAVLGGPAMQTPYWGQNVVLFGGECATTPCLDTWVYEMWSSLFRWVQYPNGNPAGLEIARAGFKAVYIWGVYVFGGIKPSTGEYLADWARYDHSSNVWTAVTLSTGSPPDPGRAHSAVFSLSEGGLGVICGVADGGVFQSCSEMLKMKILSDPAVGRWDPTVSCSGGSCPVDGIATAYWSDLRDSVQPAYYFILGAQVWKIVGTTTKSWHLVLDGNQNSDNVNSPLQPGSRIYAPAGETDCEFGAWAYIYGGYGYDASGTEGRLDGVWEFDMDATAWTWFKIGDSYSRPVDADAVGVTYGADSHGYPGSRAGHGFIYTRNPDTLLDEGILFGGEIPGDAKKGDLWSVGLRRNVAPPAPTSYEYWNQNHDWEIMHSNGPDGFRRMSGFMVQIAPSFDLLLQTGNDFNLHLWRMGTSQFETVANPESINVKGHVVNVHRHRVAICTYDGLVTVFHGDGEDTLTNVDAGGTSPGYAGAVVLRMKHAPGFYVVHKYVTALDRFEFFSWGPPPSGQWGAQVSLGFQQTMDIASGWTDYAGTNHYLYIFETGYMVKIDLDDNYALRTVGGPMPQEYGTSPYTPGGWTFFTFAPTMSGRRAYAQGGYRSGPEWSGRLWAYDLDLAFPEMPELNHGWVWLKVVPTYEHGAQPFGADTTTAGDLTPGCTERAVLSIVPNYDTNVDEVVVRWN